MTWLVLWAEMPISSLKLRVLDCLAQSHPFVSYFNGLLCFSYGCTLGCPSQYVTLLTSILVTLLDRINRCS
ncbi:hypothetical protein BDV38DRAFT_219269 [Aspergillus pseudotamarii]|uniref:Uncharacterized protein n=1 Tax=Aspergillus pseudotamarii TaxID=132259 RepID=A0A5N6T449_ASPPS|nr:uncharacterized protein BDV38DRAFT_219269 [Aspergillus pseudotamarii]KAE8141039.1 hypothetical protein BDV38DRAFT_219269 [Aspergillus pseudotamarii]